jgi:hypothetical protein
MGVAGVARAPITLTLPITNPTVPYQNSTKAIFDFKQAAKAPSRNQKKRLRANPIIFYPIPRPPYIQASRKSSTPYYYTLALYPPGIPLLAFLLFIHFLASSAQNTQLATATKCTISISPSASVWKMLCSGGK